MSRERLQILRKQIDEHDGRTAVAAEFLMVMAGGFEGAIDECLGVRKFGKGYFDVDYGAHWRCGVSEARGTLVVLCPDGIHGVSAPLNGFVHIVVPYCERLLMSGLAAALLHNVTTGVGELKIANESSLESGKPVNGIVT
ncbi:hypothetical protein AC578_4150 [Pseudocercospora eumusae]|uniref:Uncharacterized protein n=1 Tax=Pseudocercospora eumusae TaxID=321146 RepID=A0A139GWJ7_9PEZI|nr:hypothetical protein AC578_4150 [Pseudocercospora eumusae]